MLIFVKIFHKMQQIHLLCHILASPWKFKWISCFTNQKWFSILFTFIPSFCKMKNSKYQTKGQLWSGLQLHETLEPGYILWNLFQDGRQRGQSVHEGGRRSHFKIHPNAKPEKFSFGAEAWTKNCGEKRRLLLVFIFFVC